MSDKQRYRGPDIIEVGDAKAITMDTGEPVRDNPGEEPVSWYDASKDPTNPINQQEGTLADEGSGSGESSEA
jgi:hypothetical protein